MDSILNHKYCSKCHDEKVFSEFGKCVRYKDKLNRICKICARKNYKKYLERKRERDGVSKYTVYTLDNLIDLFKEEGYTLISEAYLGVCGVLEAVCPKNHIVKTSVNNFVNKKRRCRLCSIEKNSNEQKHSFDFIKQKFYENGFYLSSCNYTNSRDLLDIECFKGHKKKISYHDFFRKNKIHKCFDCNGKAFKEAIVRNIFETIFNKKFPRTRPSWLISDRGRRMELDGYCEELKLAFEYDGEYHYRETRLYQYFQSSMDKQALRDILKTSICKDNSIILIRIPYNIKDLEEFIKNELIDVGFYDTINHAKKSIPISK